MIKIAFCDDDMEVLHQINELLDRYRVERNEDITYAAFQSPFELLTEIDNRFYRKNFKNCKNKPSM